MSLGMWVASEVGKGKEMDYPPELPVGTQPLRHPECSAVKLESNVCPIKLQDDEFVLSCQDGSNLLQQQQ